MTDLIKRLDEIDAAYAASTKGPWFQHEWYETDGDGWAARGPLRRDETDLCCEPNGPSHLEAKRDSALMVLAVNAAPCLSRIARAAAAEREAKRRLGSDPTPENEARHQDAEDALDAALDAAEAGGV